MHISVHPIRFEYIPPRSLPFGWRQGAKRDFFYAHGIWHQMNGQVASVCVRCACVYVNATPRPLTLCASVCPYGGKHAVNKVYNVRKSAGLTDNVFAYADACDFVRAQRSEQIAIRFPRASDVRHFSPSCL